MQQVQFKKISDTTFKFLYKQKTLNAGALYFIVSANNNTFIKQDLSDILITKGQIWLAKSENEIQLYTNSINKISIDNNKITIVEDLGKKTSIELPSLGSIWEDFTFNN